jgi:hypothetical protein
VGETATTSELYSVCESISQPPQPVERRKKKKVSTSSSRDGRSGRRGRGRESKTYGGSIVALTGGSTGTGSREATGSTSTGSAASSTVGLGHDGVGDGLELLLLLLVLLLRGLSRSVEPRDRLGDRLLERLLVGSVELVLEVTLDRGTERVGCEKGGRKRTSATKTRRENKREKVKRTVGLESVLGGDAGSGGLVLSLVLLGVVDHALDLLLRETTLVVGDGDLVRLAGGLVGSGDVENTVGVDVEGNLDLRNTTGRGGDARELELSEEVVVLGAGTLTLEDLDEDTGLVVGVGGEGLGLLGGDGGVACDARRENGSVRGKEKKEEKARRTGNELGHDTTSGLDTGRERGNVEEEEVLGLLGRVTGEDGSLDGGTVGDGLVGVDRLVGLLAAEEVGDELLDTGDTGRATDEDNLVDGLLVDLRVAEDLLDGLHGGAEEVLAELLETGTGDRGVEVNTLEERVDLDGGLGGRGEGTLGTLASGAETTESTSVGGEVLLVLALELGDEVGDETAREEGVSIEKGRERKKKSKDEPVVEVLTSQVRVTSGGLNLEDTLLDGKEGDIERSSSKVEDEDVLLALGLLVETVSDGSGGGLVDDTEDVETSDDTGVLGSLTLGVVEAVRGGRKTRSAIGRRGTRREEETH